jgi:cytosine/adenosine deaminase-related metal-dependent hydrolase
MMDVNDAYPRLKESTVDAMKSTRALAERWHNSCKGRIRYAAAPRFVLSCSDRLLNETRELMESFDGMLLHTHASENMLEVQAVRERCKMENIEFLHRLGLLSSKTCLAHCVHLTEAEIGMLQQTRTNVTHCPSSNLKLGSGIAKIPYLMSKGINVSLGADGAPCNNTLNMFQEMRLASLIQKPVHGPTAMPAQTMFTMATIGGARTLGMEREIGSIEAGKKADLVVLDLNDVWNPVGEDNIYSSIVYSASPENVDSVMIDGKWIYRKKVFIGLNEEDIVQTSKKELKQLLERAEKN